MVAANRQKCDIQPQQRHIFRIVKPSSSSTNCNFLQNVLKRKKTYVVEEKRGFNSPSPPPPSRPRSTNWKLEEEEEETKELQIVDVSQELRKSFVDGGSHCSFVCSFVPSFPSAPLSPKMFILVFFFHFVAENCIPANEHYPPKSRKAGADGGRLFIGFSEA